MKKSILIVFAFISQITLMKAQDVSDALRVGMEDLDGTARFVSMGGAFGALGGDISSIKANPAASSVFLMNQASISLDINAFENATNYGNSSNTYRNNKFDMNQAGAVFVFNNMNESADVTRLSFGVTYDRTSSFKNRFQAIGTSDESLGDMFLDFAQGVPLDLFIPYSDESLDELYSYLGSADEGFNNNRLQTAYLGYEGYLFNAVDESNLDQTDYISNVSGNKFEHGYKSAETGLKGQITFNGGLAVADQFYFGLNLNSHFMDYQQTIYMDEFIGGSSEINEINFDNTLDTKGTGFSFGLGGIAKLDDMWRVGVSYESPTWYKISEETTQFLRTYSNEFGEVVVNPQVVNIYPDYRMRTPGQINGSVAAVFGGDGLLSFEYSYKDFSKTKFSSGGFQYENDEIKDQLRGVNTYRIGGEYRLQGFSLRAGLRYQDSPYENKIIGDMRGYSAGLGYDFGPVKADFAYDHSNRKYDNQLLHTGFSQTASIKNNLSHYVLTLTFDL